MTQPQCCRPVIGSLPCQDCPLTVPNWCSPAEDTRRQNCTHPKLPEVPFDAEKAKGMSDAEVRKAYPRLDQYCEDCKQQVICYASAEHYYAGDW